MDVGKEMQSIERERERERESGECVCERERGRGWGPDAGQRKSCPPNRWFQLSCLRGC